MKNNITNCTFTGVKFDAQTVSTIETIALGLLENARALGALAAVFEASNIHIDSLLHVGEGKTHKE